MRAPFPWEARGRRENTPLPGDRRREGRGQGGRSLRSRRRERSGARWLVAIALAGMGCGGAAGRGGDEEPRNLLLISIDTLRADHLGCYGYPRPTSPAVDRLAGSGVVFEDVTSPAPWTLPAHASMLTGVYPSHHGLWMATSHLPEDVPTLAEVLRGRGIHTAAFVNSLYLSRRFGLERGFNAFTYVKGSVDRRKPTRIRSLALDWLSYAPPEPFFLFLHFLDVHSDYHSLPRYEAALVRPYTGVANGRTGQLLAVREGRLTLDARDASHLADLYDAGIRQMDDGIDEILRYLDQRGLRERTLVVVTSDHGEEFLDHGGVLHSATHYQELVHVPWIVSGPGVPQGVRVRRPVSLVDLPPTLHAAMGLGRFPGGDGRDVSPLWMDASRGAAPSPEVPSRYLFCEANKSEVLPGEDDPALDSLRAVRHGPYKLHLDRRTGTIRLFDLAADPGETRDVKDDHPEEVAAMRRQLETLATGRRVGDSPAPLSPEEQQQLESLGYR